MDAEALKALQAPIKERYRETPDAAVVTLTAEEDIYYSKVYTLIHFPLKMEISLEISN
jgi:hypothetical protein